VFVWFFVNVARLVKFNLFEFSHVLELLFPCCVCVLLFVTWLLCTIGPFNPSLCIPNVFWNLLVVRSLFFSTPTCYVFFVFFNASLPCTFNVFNIHLLCVFGVFHLLLIMCSWCFLMPIYFLFLMFFKTSLLCTPNVFWWWFLCGLNFFNTFLLHTTLGALWHLFITLS
jgi:hypothetical protein